MEDAKSKQLLILSLTPGYIALQQVHGISISKCQLQPIKQLVANDRQRIHWPRAAPCWHRWCVITSSAASTVASDAWLCTRLWQREFMNSLWLWLWLRLATWYRVHVAHFMRRPSASVTLVLCHGRGGESHLTHLQSQCWWLSAGAVGQLVSVTSVWATLLLMRAAVSADAHSLNQMAKLTCVNADVRFHWNQHSPLVRFCPHLAWPPLPPLGADVLYGWPLIDDDTLSLSS